MSDTKKTAAGNEKATAKAMKIRWHVVWEKALSFVVGVMLLSILYGVLIAIAVFIKSFSCK
jgi:hypothetical protein